MYHKFGIELEMANIDMNTAVARLSSIESIKIDKDTEYRKTDYDKWKVQSDASIEHESYKGCEVVSPILTINDFNQIDAVCHVLAEAGAVVNRSCGFHVHIDASDLSAQHIRNILERYAKFETVIDSFMPKSRRDNANNHCSSISQQLDFVKKEYNEYYSNNNDKLCSSLQTRHLKVNCESYNRQGTIEFRHHSGTLEPEKIKNWILFLMHFIDASKPDYNTYSTCYTASVKEYEKVVKTIENPYDHRHHYMVGTTIISSSHKLIYNKLTSNLGSFISVEVLANYTGLMRERIPAYISHIRRAYHVEVENSRQLGYRITNLSSFASTKETVVTQLVDKIIKTGLSQHDYIWNNIPKDVKNFYENRILQLQ